MTHKKRTCLLSVKIGTDSSNYVKHYALWTSSFICDCNANDFTSGNQRGSLYCTSYNLSVNSAPKATTKIVNLYRCEVNERGNISNEKFIEEPLYKSEKCSVCSNRLAEENIRKKRERRRLGDISNQVSSRPMKVQVKEKEFNIQSPNIIPICNIPLIENDNLYQMSTRVDICLSSNTNYASPELLKEHTDIKEKHRGNAYLNAIEGASDLLTYCTSVSKYRFLDSVSECKYDEYDNSEFHKFIKFSMIDFGVNISRPTHMPMNDERTMCEKKDKDAATAIFYANQEKEKGYLLDGIGSNESKTASIIIESSGINITTNVEHTLEDSIKNIKSATDALVNVIMFYLKYQLVPPIVTKTNGLKCMLIMA